PEPDGGNEGGPAGRDRASSRCSREAARRQPIHYRRQIYGGRRLSVHGAQLDQYPQDRSRKMAEHQGIHGSNRCKAEGAGNHAGGRSAGIAHTHPARLHEVRSGHRPDDRQSARPRRAADAACPRRRGYRMNRRELFVSFSTPWNRHFWHPKCQTSVQFDTLDSSFVRGSLDHLVGEREQLVWNLEAKRLGGFEIDHKLEPSRLHDGEVSWLLSVENAASINSSLAICLAEAGSVTHQSASHSELAPLIYRRNCIACSQCHESCALGVEEWIGSDDERTDPLLDEGCEGCAELVPSGSIHDVCLQPKCSCRRLQTR